VGEIGENSKRLYYSIVNNIHRHIMATDILAQLEDLKWQLAGYQKKCKQYAEEVAELRTDLHNTLIENEALQEKLRLGIKRGDVYIRDSHGSILIM
jgi:hypothetical protein